MIAELGTADDELVDDSVEELDILVGIGRGDASLTKLFVADSDVGLVAGSWAADSITEE